MKKTNKRKITIGAIAIALILILTFIPKPVYIEFGELKQPNELNQMFQDIPITNIKVDAIGVNESGGGIVDNLDDIVLLLKDIELESGRNIIGIEAMEFNVSGIDLIYLLTHKKNYDIANIYVVSVILGKIEDQIERSLFFMH